MLNHSVSEPLVIKMVSLHSGHNKYIHQDMIGMVHQHFGLNADIV